MIPKVFHFIWVGDESRRPDNCIQTWRDAHPDWTFRIWGNDELAAGNWINTMHMRAMSQRELNGVADMMRWEILHEHGGIVFDADSVCRRPLDDSFLDCEAFACWENEIARPGLIAAGYFGCEAGNPFVGQIIADIQNEPTVVDRMAWESVGPMRLTQSYRQHVYTPLRIYPSHYFIPTHFTGLTYQGKGPVYADQLWGSTNGSYEQLHTLDLEARSLPDIATSAASAYAAEAPAQTKAQARVQELARAQTANPVHSQIERLHDAYFVQKVTVGTELMGLSRMQVLGDLCAGKRVLHVGCADWPITDLNSSLHLHLDKVCARLDGLDPHVEALDLLRPHVKGRLFADFSEVTDDYDVVLVPEVMEHVPDVGDFLAKLSAVKAQCYLMSVPDAYQCRAGHFDYIDDSETFVEVVHPDHNVWYTPYTFQNTIRKYSDMTVERMWFFNGISLLALLSPARLAAAA
ncbi:glycosyltransferase [Novosphingobium terrae]|uniref:glycosyltransferase n=1 Tax=Novosphingobium terrae TaxID=2726189 RepID=UPI00198012C4|nr:glycosyltransferase [Novosphingobium terrae]